MQTAIAEDVRVFIHVFVDMRPFIQYDRAIIGFAHYDQPPCSYDFLGNSFAR